MVLSEFQKVSIDKFKGLYRRGLMDEVPTDHAAIVENMSFTNVGEAFTRPGAQVSLNLTHPVKRSFLATNAQGYFLLTMDNSGILWSYNCQTLTDAVLKNFGSATTDFAAINLFGKTFIQPVGPLILNVALASYGVYLFDGVNIRLAAGFPPVKSTSTPLLAVTNAGGPAGNTSPGVYRFAVSFVTDSGFTTRPGPVDWGGIVPGDWTNRGTFSPEYWVSPGAIQVQLWNIPTGPPGTIARQIFVTKADQQEYFYLNNSTNSGYIPDNTSTFTSAPLILDWFDTDLAISADSLFDNMDWLPAGVIQTGPGYGTQLGLFKYHGRLLIWGNPNIGNDKILASESGDPETFSVVHGYIQMPSDFDANMVRGMGVLRDTLYLFRGIGIFATQDTLDNPNTWPIVRVDGSSGAWYFSINTISSAQSAIPLGDVLVVGDRSGLYVFNGVVQQPPLTWKVNDLWRRIPKNRMSQVTVDIDPFEQLVYILFPIDNDTLPSYLLVGDFTEGLDYLSIKWSRYVFPFLPRSIGMALMPDNIDNDYYIRIGCDDNLLYRIDRPNYFGGYQGDILAGTVSSTYKTACLPLDSGKMSIFRAIVYRTTGWDVLNTWIGPEDTAADSSNPVGMIPAPDVNLAIIAQREVTLQINMMAEKIQLLAKSNKPFKLNRIDFYGKTQFDARPM